MAIFTGVALDLFSDGVMIGTASLINPSLGLLLALGQVPADIPEGFAAIATLKRAKVKRSQRILLSLAFGIPILLGASIGYFVLRDEVANDRGDNGDGQQDPDDDLGFLRGTGR